MEVTKSWLLAVPPEFKTPVDFKRALAAAVLATVSREIELGFPSQGCSLLAQTRRMARSHLEGYPHLRQFANYQVHQRVCTKKKTPARSRQSPARACGVSRVGPTASTPCPGRSVLPGKPHTRSKSGLVVELTDLAPQVFHETATALLARLPPQHRRSTSGKGSGGNV